MLQIANEFAAAFVNGDVKRTVQTAANALVLIGANAAPYAAQEYAQKFAARWGVSELKALRVGRVAGTAASTLLGASFTFMSARATAEAGRAFFRAVRDVEDWKSQISATEDSKRKLELTNSRIEAERRKADSAYALITGALDTGAGGFTTWMAGMAFRRAGAGRFSTIASILLASGSAAARLGPHLYSSLDVINSVFEKSGIIERCHQAPGLETRTVDTLAGRHAEDMYQQGNPDSLGAASQRRTPGGEAPAKHWFPGEDIRTTGKVMV